MIKEIVYGLGGYCENCDPSHPHPLNNIVEIIEAEDVVEQVNNVELLAQALLELPVETLDALKQALGIGENNG